MPRVIGIDLGTTCSAVAVMEAGRPVVLPNREGSRSTPSVVALTRDGEVLVGEGARRQAVTNPDRTIFSVKRHMGSGWRVDVDGRSYTAPEISAHILAKLKRDAEARLGEPVAQAVITVPASFSEPQRIATKLAGEMAGLKVLRLVNESSAAAIAHGFDPAGDIDEPDRTVLVLHLGGGTFGVSVVEMGDGVFEVKTTRGDAQLGGDDWDRRLVDWLVSRFWSTHGVDLSTDPVAAQRLHEAAEGAKTDLSQAHQARVELPFISATGTAGQRPLDLDETVSRAALLDLTAHLLDRCRGSVEGAIGDADIRPDQIDDVILVGDATRMPAVHDLVRDLTGKEPLHRAKEVVAAGAAIQAGVLTGDVMDVLLLDVVPLSLGIEAEGGAMIRVIERNTTIPERCTMIFTTAEDNQTSVDINVFQGEAEQAQHNTPLGRFQLVGLPSARRGVPEIEVTFDIDANGILHVSARDRATNQEQSIVATG